jgi:putative membrane protein
MIFLRWAVSAFAIFLVPFVVPGVSVRNVWTALVAALIIGLINVLIRPVLLLLTLPVNVLTLGLFTLVINALLFWLTSSIVKGFDVSGFWAAFFGAIIYWLIAWIGNMLVSDT